MRTPRHELAARAKDLIRSGSPEMACAPGPGLHRFLGRPLRWRRMLADDSLVFALVSGVNTPDLYGIGHSPHGQHQGGGPKIAPLKLG